MKIRKTPVFVFKADPGQVGNGVYGLVACFINLGIHVPFKIYCHSENTYLDSVGRSKLCDGSCGCGVHGSLHDFSDSNDDYCYPRMVKAAHKAHQAAQKRRKRKVLDPAVKLPKKQIEEIRKAVEEVYGKDKKEKWTERERKIGERVIVTRDK